ncbi:MAG: cell wall metabolism sensor histidine kinase WalK [Candidatus Aminicenantes bacterium]|nr:cell wall metabolism sensor histidine kinase WalK [Candidatus Aminicenantes bacterium]
MKRSIFIKIFSGYLLIIIALTVLISVLSYNAIKDFHLDTLSRDLANLGSSLRFHVLSYFEGERFGEMDSFVKEFGKNINTRITVVDREGVVLADSDEDPKSMVNHRFRPEIATALEGEVGESLRFSNTVKEDMLYVGLPLERNGEITGVLRVSLYLKDIKIFLSQLRSTIFRIVLLITALALVGALFFTFTFSRPIREMTLASKRIASGDFDTKVFLKSRDELRELAKSFNYMTEEIQNLFTELSRQKEELASIISSIEEGLLALGQDGKILLSNESFNRIIQNERVEGKYYWEAVRKPEFIELIKKVQEEKKNYAEELLFDGKTYLCSAALLPSREEIVVTLHDITKIRELEKIKKDFVVNVSHELRTPLTAIKGYVETLEEEVNEKAGEFLKIIKKHTDRLILIVKDLLLLSELEEKESKLEPEKVDVKSLIENVLAIFEQPLKEKKLKAEIKVLNKIPSVKGDPFKLEQMFLNIIDNAVKYTKKGKITVLLKKEDKNLSVEIEDTGIGIPEEHMSRIFERFYVVDKSRSRSLGGTGLGLSIVKHIVLLHNGQVNVESTPGKGTKFTVILPV